MSRGRILADPGAIATSVLIHALLVGGGAWLLHRSLTERAQRIGQSPTLTIEVGTVESGVIDLPAMASHGPGAAADPTAEPESREAQAALGGEHLSRPDLKRAGRGGTDRASESALNLADSNDGLSLDRDPMNRLDRSQIQRLKTDRERESLDDRRATPNPMELSFLSSGSGKLAIRRQPAPADPSRGTSAGAIAETEGSLVGGPETEAGAGHEPEAGGEKPGREREIGALGVPSSQPGSDYRRSASVALARPMVTRSRAAVPAPTRGRPNDTVDSSQDVARYVASLVHASNAGGRTGSGPGGERAPGSPASGGPNGTGSLATPSGSGAGALLDVGADGGVIGWFRGIERKVEPYWRKAFPDWAISEGRGGLVTITMVVQKDGTLISASVARSSGIAEFDKNILIAVRRAAPFAPLPPRLRPGPQVLRMTFDATNPAVGRDSGGIGGTPR
jgi:TonB family protein